MDTATPLISTERVEAQHGYSLPDSQAFCAGSNWAWCYMQVLCLASKDNGELIVLSSCMI